MESEKQSFDPYLKWLGIRDPERPVNYYRLLGVERNESDPDVIATSADRQMSHVRRYQSGQFAELSQELLNELAAARLVLLDPKRRAEYDRRNTPRESNEAETRSPTRAAALVIAAVACAATVTLYFGLRKEQSPDVVLPKETPRVAASDQDAMTSPAATESLDKNHSAEIPSEVVDVNSSTKLEQHDTENTPETDSDDPPVLDAPKERPNFVEANVPIKPLSIPTASSVWTDIKVLISERDFEGATREFVEAESAVETRGDDETYAALSDILRLSKQFWLAVETAINGGVTPNTTISYGEQPPVRIVSIDAESVLIEAPDRSQANYVTKNLPPMIAAALAESMLPNTAEAHAVLGTFWSFDQNGNAERAIQRHWRYLRDDRYELLSKAWLSTEGSARQDKSPVPPSAMVKKLSTQIEQRLRIDPTSSRTGAAQMLLAEANRQPNGTSMRYVCVVRAAHFASLEGQSQLALNALGILKSEFEPTSESTRILDQLMRTAETGHMENIAKFALGAATRAIDSDDYADAMAIGKIASKAAQRSNTPAMANDTARLRTRVALLKRAYRSTSSARKRLTTAPGDSDANRIVGEFLCFKKGDFRNGLRYLAKSNSSHAMLAQRTTANAIADLDIANQWWDVASTLGKYEQGVAKSYARSLYRALLPSIRGESKKRILARLSSE